ncbi:MogA/MoaB family molybdenum cofactor biosynthesis protein [Bacillus sp. REN10]|uniref:MogA/MoaB family molybdenum cofactor biosynthesis protein n=1 Tax=Bacillus sp. REN10 TaxID=2782541 RepID=UPI00193C0DAE|nr:MogA/MoaB family molybdenum cofactor biosynthesis protein [Bacillus sp. REN10]
MHPTHAQTSVHAAILTVSDTRTMENDKSGQHIQSLLKAAEFDVVQYRIVKDEQQAITSQVHSWCEDPTINAIIVTGGTGFTPRDITYEALTSLFEKEMSGFGELFRSLSYTDIGPRAMFSRAVAGCKNKTAIYALPGSTNAVKLGMNQLIIPTVQHFIGELNRQ